MKAGRASQTAVFVCAGRALAHGVTRIPRFSDPTALALLPDPERARVARARAGRFIGLRGLHLHRLSTMMAVRTVAIDDAVRASSAPQVVILGAGLDGRAWRMPELGDAIVFEVDHPDTQRTKRARVASLAQAAREIRFVPVDFTRDALDDALARSGHDPARATTWIWEGVVMYLAQPDIEATLDVIERRSAHDSRLIVAYHAPAMMLRLIGIAVKLVGEPLRSRFAPEAMRALLARYGFAVVADGSVAELGAAMAPALARRVRMLSHLRIAVAQRETAQTGDGSIHYRS